MEAFEVEIGGEVKKIRDKAPQQPMQIEGNIERYDLSVLSKHFLPLLF